LVHRVLTGAEDSQLVASSFLLSFPFHSASPGKLPGTKACWSRFAHCPYFSVCIPYNLLFCFGSPCSSQVKCWRSEVRSWSSSEGHQWFPWSRSCLKHSRAPLIIPTLAFFLSSLPLSFLPSLSYF
jgi:hypothetical protein